MNISPSLLVNNLNGTSGGGTPTFGYTSTYSGPAIIFLSCSAFFDVSNQAPTFTINGLPQKISCGNSMLSSGPRIGTIYYCYYVMLKKGDYLYFANNQSAGGNEANSKTLTVVIYGL